MRRRGKVFTKLIKEITVVAARMGGSGDLNANPPPEDRGGRRQGGEHAQGQYRSGPSRRVRDELEGVKLRGERIRKATVPGERP